jgi:hypothetical protein
MTASAPGALWGPLAGGYPLSAKAENQISIGYTSKSSACVSGQQSGEMAGMRVTDATREFGKLWAAADGATKSKQVLFSRGMLLVFIDVCRTTPRSQVRIAGSAAKRRIRE